MLLKLPQCRSSRSPSTSSFQGAYQLCISVQVFISCLSGF